MISSGVASAGMFTVFEMAPLMKGWTPPIIRMCPRWVIERVPLSATEDAAVTMRPRGPGVYELSPFPFGAQSAEYAFAGRPVEPGQHEKNGGWSKVLAQTPTVWERFRLVAA